MMKTTTSPCCTHWFFAVFFVYFLPHLLLSASEASSAFSLFSSISSSLSVVVVLSSITTTTTAASTGTATTLLRASSSSSSSSSSRLPPPPPHNRLPWGDVNVLIVTDVHSWIGGHARHKESSSLWNNNNNNITLDADYGHVLSFYQHLQEYAALHRRTLLFVMNGDFTDGTGLTTYPPSRLCQLLETYMPWDAINVGNHELYRNATVDALVGGGPDMNGGFIDFWKGKYLTSNVLSSATGLPLGSRFRIVIQSGGGSGGGSGSGDGDGNDDDDAVRILTFGFLYNMIGNCAATIVEPVQDVIQQEWFINLLTSNNNNNDNNTLKFDAILVLAHMDYMDALVTNVLLPTIRQYVGPDMPIQFVTGHSHIRGVAQLDPMASTMEAGRYLDTIGFVSFPTVVKNNKNIRNQSNNNNNNNNNNNTQGNTSPSASSSSSSSSSSLLFQHVFIDANRETLRSIVNVSQLDTPDGIAFSQSIQQTQQDMGLLEPIGCSPKTYYLDVSLNTEQSLWSLYVTQVLPIQLFAPIREHTIHTSTSSSSSSNNNNNNNKNNNNDGSSSNISALPILVQGTGALRYDLFEGLVVVDDIIAVCPYRDVVYQLLPSVRGDELKRILDYNNRILSSSSLPPFIIAGEDWPDLVDDHMYQLLTVDFDVKFWTQRIANVTGLLPPTNNGTVTSLWNDKTGDEVTTTQLWMDFVQTQWPLIFDDTNDDDHHKHHYHHLPASCHALNPDSSNNNNNSNNYNIHDSSTPWWWFGAMMFTMMLVATLILFLTWRILCLALWRYRQGYYSAPSSLSEKEQQHSSNTKQQQQQQRQQQYHHPIASSTTTCTESPTFHSDDDDDDDDDYEENGIVE